jgi:tape measure domain-containing protein
MSRDIDQRVVEMQFDNAQFERGIKQSIFSLQRLKQGLNLGAATSSLQSLDSAAKRFSLSGLSAGIDAVSVKFNALGIVGITAIQNITNSAINAGKRLVSSLAIEPITDGFKEYELKMNSIQTILSNTSSKGTTLDEVNEALAELNEYADKTIYNYAQMTDNAARFTAAGVGLKDSLYVIKGLSNAAAGFGVNAERMAGATFQMAQGLNKGYINLQDWMSMETAGMAGQSMQTALKDMAKSLGIVVPEGEAFRETLREGWLTSEVFIKTMQKMADDPALLEAATNVTTFTKLLGTMKEAVASGWASTWENIFGNKDESTKLWTGIANAFGEIVGASANARNSMLKDWSMAGGRTDLLLGVANAFKAIGAILSPIEEAFKTVFPPITVSTLLTLSDRFKRLTANLIINEGVALKIKNVFIGLFSSIKIGVNIIKNIVVLFFNLLKSLTPIGSMILNVASNFSLLISEINKSTSSANILNKVFSTLGSAITFVINAITKFIIKISEMLKVGDSSNYIFGVMINVIKNASVYFYKFASIASNVFKSLSDGISSVMRGADFNQVFDTINSGLFAFILLGVRKFINSLTDITSNFGGFADQFKDILDGVKGSLQAFQTSLKANVLIKISIAIGILALSLMTLAKIDPEKLTVALTAMTTLFLELFGSMAVFEKLLGGAGFVSMGKITLSMIGLSVAVLILTKAIKTLADLDWGTINKGLFGVASLSLMLVGVSKLLQNTSVKLIRGSLGLIVFSAAILTLTKSVEKLGNLDYEVLKKGLISVGVLLTQLAVFLKVTDVNKLGLVKSVGILVLSSALLVLSNAVRNLADLDTNSLIKGLSAMAGILLQLGLFVNLTGDSKRVFSTAIGLTILGGAILILSNALMNMASMSWSEIAKGLIVLAGALTIITVAMAFMTTGVIGATAFIVISTALLILSNTMKSLGSMSWTEIAKGLIVLAGALTIITVAMALMTTGVAGAAALIVIAGALAILTPVLTSLGQMSLGEIGKSLLMLAGAFTVIGLAGLVLTPIIPSLLGLAGAITLLGIGIAAIGGGVLAFSAALTGLAVSGAAGAAALVVVITSIIGLIPMAATTLAKGVIEFVKTIGDGIPLVVKAIEKIVVAILDTLIKVTPKALEFITVLLDGVIELLIKYIPKLVDAVIQIIISLADTIYKRKDDVKEAINYLVDVILEVLGGIVTKVFDIGKNIVTGLYDGIKSAKDTAVNGAKDLGNKVIGGIKNVFQIKSPSKIFRKIGENITNSLGLGIKDEEIETVNTATTMGKSVTDGTNKGIKSGEKTTKQAVKDYTEGIKKAYEEGMAWVDEEKYYNRLSLEGELAKYIEMQQIVIEGTEERKKLNREVFRVEKEMLNQDVEESKRLYDKKYQDSLNWIDKEKYYKRLALFDELAAWERVQNRYAEGSEESLKNVEESKERRLKAEREVFRVKNEINKSNEDYLTKVIEIESSANDKRIKMEEDYHSKVKELNSKLKQDIKAIADEYTQAVTSRTQSLYSSYGLFDKVDERSPIDGFELMSNLKDQVVEFDSWRKSIQELARKGVDEGLISELEKMGPKSIEQIKAINRFNKPMLDQYVSLWRTKNEEAREQALDELDGLRVESINKIAELNKNTKVELEEYKNTWNEQLTKLQNVTVDSITDVTKAWMSQIGTLKTDTEKEMFLTALKIKSAINSQNWSEIGGSFGGAIRGGFENEIRKMIDDTTRTVKDVLDATDVELGIQTTPKALNGAKAGVTVMQRSLKDMAKDTTNFINNGFQTLKTALLDNIDTTPTIRPVLDLSAVASGGAKLAALLPTSPLLATAGVAMNLASNIKSTNSSSSLLQQVLDKFKPNNQTPTTIHNSLNVENMNIRDDSDVQLISRELENMNVKKDRG